MRKYLLVFFTVVRIVRQKLTA